MSRRPYAEAPSVAFERPQVPELPPSESRPVASKPPQEKCDHGGLIINGVAYCGICAEQGDDVDSFNLFLESLYDLCGRVAWKIYFRSIPYGDRKHHAFVSILDNLKVIIGAKNPYGMAVTIAQRSVRDMTRKAYHWNEWPASQLNVGGSTEKGARAGSIEDFADARMAAGLEGEPLQMEIPYFPGARQLWKPVYLHRLEASLDAALRQLPWEQVLVVKAYFGFYEECGPLTLEECRKINGMSKDQVRYAIKQAVENMRKFMETGAAKLVAESRSKQAN